ncbi:MAG: antibiotic biosynthesis monooxygenase [Muribaculaceae bacterium]|nr:antibiotic biosynthesis monooxygenase [Muribaculaceae bacterium]
MHGLHSCSHVDIKINDSNIMETEKKNIGSLIALYPKPLTTIGAEVDGKVNWLTVGHTGIIGHDCIEVIGKYLNLDKEPVMCVKEPMSTDGIVRLSKIEVFPQHLNEYMKYAVEVGEISLRTEPGVLTMYAISEKDNPCKITILETYASREAYEKHIASEHFKKYKQGTLHMVKSLVLSDQTPLNPANQINNFIQ